MAPAHRRAAFPAAVGVAVVVALVLVAALVVWLLSAADQPETKRSPAPVESSETTTAAAADPVPWRVPARTGICAQLPERPFVPRTITVNGVTRDAEVLPLPRDAAGVPGVPPVDAKQVFAWDRGGVRPGARKGHVLLNTHTYPDGSAMGNALLAGLKEGDRIVLRHGAAAACYRVTKRVQVREEDGYPGWAATDGPHQVVIVVCSGDRLGPGRWTHRTLWFASPIR